MSKAATTGARQRLLDAALDHVAANGVSDLSLRQLAAALGTSHRMLIYHFGSKEKLLVALIQTVEQRQRAALATLDDATAASTDTIEVMRRFWRRLADPALWPHERLFFEMYGQALQGRTGTTALLDGVVAAWLEPLAALIRRAGVAPEDARAHARVAVAITRGLLLDLLATGDRDGVDEAAECFLTTWAASLPERQ